MGRMSEADPALAIEDLLARLGARDNEQAVASLAVSLGPEEWRLRFGSLLLGPADMADLSWCEWSDIDGGRERWASLRDSAAHLRRFDQKQGDWRLLRFPLAVRDLVPWLTRVLQEGKADVPDGGEPFVATLRPADSLLRVFTHVNTPAALLAGMVGRPLLGWVHPLITDDVGQDTQPLLDEFGIADGRNVPTLTALGLSTRSVFGTEAQPALLVARADRPAWVSELRGSQPNLDTFNVRLRLMPDEVRAWELVLDLEEHDRDGELLSARRLPLADVSLPDRPGDDITVALPTVGRGVTRRVRLYHRDGTLLDAADDVHLVEQINVTGSVMGAGSHAAPTTVTAGDNTRHPSLIQRLEAQDRVEGQYAELLAQGADGRVVAVGDDGRGRLRQLLSDAYGSLAVVDPYFGKDQADWDVLEEVSVPVRVLTGKNKSSRPRSLTLVVERREWPTTREPFHDRWYLWEGGGLTVGTSPNGLGRRLSLLDRLEPAMAANLLQRFEQLWQQADPLP